VAPQLNEQPMAVPSTTEVTPAMPAVDMSKKENTEPVPVR
jgi:hypothetical protein